jgi:hypothetical protein
VDLPFASLNLSVVFRNGKSRITRHLTVRDDAGNAPG